MPQRALQVCSTPDCPTLTPEGACPDCKATRRRNQARQRRATGDQAMRIYSTQAWRDDAASFFQDHPTCEDCGAPATQRDHTPPRRLLVAAGIHEPDDRRWLHGRCDTCHSRKTQTIDIPLLQRWAAGESAQHLCEEAMKLTEGVGDTT